MPLTWTIAGVDKSATIRYDGWTLCEMAQRGQVGAATVTLDDTAGTYLPPAQKAVTVDESSATPARLFTGYVAERTTSSFRMPPGQRQWVVTFEDQNVLLDDRVIAGDSGNRPAETDRERLNWLFVSGAMGPIGKGTIHGAADDVDMDKVDYRGKRPRDVLEEISQKSGANYFVYDLGAGPLLFYDVGTNATFTSTVYLSDAAADIDSATVFGIQNPEYSYDPSRVYSKVRLRYKQGSATVRNDVTGSNFRVREMYKRWGRIKTQPKAIQQGTKWLDHASTETRSLKCSVVMGAQYVNLIRAGHRVPIKLTRHGMSGYEYWRVVGRWVRPINDVTYQVELELRDKVKPTRFFEGPDVSVDEEFSNATDVSVADAPGVVIDADSITVRNASNTVIIDAISYFWSVLATGALTLPRWTQKGLQKQSVDLTIANVPYAPTTLFATTADARDGTGKWGHVLPEMSISASGVILRAIQGRARYKQGAGSNTQVTVQVSRFSTTGGENPVTINYWVMDKRSE